MAVAGVKDLPQLRRGVAPTRTYEPTGNEANCKGHTLELMKKSAFFRTGPGGGEPPPRPSGGRNRI